MQKIIKITTIVLAIALCVGMFMQNPIDTQAREMMSLKGGEITWKTESSNNSENTLKYDTIAWIITITRSVDGRVVETDRVTVYEAGSAEAIAGGYEGYINRESKITEKTNKGNCGVCGGDGVYNGKECFWCENGTFYATKTEHTMAISIDKTLAKLTKIDLYAGGDYAYEADAVIRFGVRGKDGTFNQNYKRSGAKRYNSTKKETLYLKDFVATTEEEAQYYWKVAHYIIYGYDKTTKMNKNFDKYIKNEASAWGGKDYYGQHVNVQSYSVTVKGDYGCASVGVDTKTGDETVSITGINKATGWVDKSGTASIWGNAKEGYSLKIKDNNIPVSQSNPYIISDINTKCNLLTKRRRR